MAKSKKCPVCGARIKVENLGRHIKRVHPKEKIDLKLTEKEKDEVDRGKEREKKLTRTSRKPIIVAAAIVIITILIVAIFMMYPRGSPNAQVTTTSYDFGTVYNPETLTHDFKIKNNGTGVLEITKIETSCVCTNATMKVGGKVGGPFSEGESSSPSDWKGYIDPGETATLTVDFDTLFFIEPQSGQLMRSVFVYTNDPSHSKITFQVSANIIR